MADAIFIYSYLMLCYKEVVPLEEGRIEYESNFNEH
jgi:hypothetical protein